MVEFQTVDSKEIKFGNNKFLEVAIKLAKTREGDNEIISISKGFITPDGQKRFKTALGFGADKEILNGLINALTEIKEMVGTTGGAEPAQQVVEESPEQEAPVEEAPAQEEAPQEEF